MDFWHQQANLPRQDEEAPDQINSKEYRENTLIFQTSGLKNKSSKLQLQNRSSSNLFPFNKYSYLS